MTYEKFLDCLEQELHDLMKNGEEIRRVEVLKNNSVRLDGFSYRMPYRKEEPTVYVNHYYRKNMDMTDIREIATAVLPDSAGKQKTSLRGIKRSASF